MSSLSRRRRAASRLHDKFNTPAIVVSVIALVFALVGGAYAASNALTGKQKKEVEKISKKFAGKPGSPGANGPAGAAGPAGAKGDTGAKGDKGDAGTSVVSEEFGLAGKDGKCVSTGGTKFVSASGPSYACNGKEGSPWTDGGTLPPGALETGTFSFHGTEAENPSVGAALSFPIPLAQEIPRSHIHIFGVDPEAEFEAACFLPGAEFTKPDAKPGEMCIWPAVADMESSEINSIVPLQSGPNAGTENVGPTGGIIYATMSGTGRGSGSFAVRGCGGVDPEFACP
jgi:hypothetical protein